MVFGLSGLCRCDELYNLRFDEVEDHGDFWFVNLNRTKTSKIRDFLIDKKFYPLIKKYVELRLPNAPVKHFFTQYKIKNEECTVTPVGINTIYAQPRVIANYLKLSKGNYTGHSFRRSGSTFVVESGGDMMMLKNAGGWKSDKIAQSYVEYSKFSRQKVANLISNSLIPQPLKENLQPAKKISESTEVHLQAPENPLCIIRSRATSTKTSLAQMTSNSQNIKKDFWSAKTISAPTKAYLRERENISSGIRSLPSTITSSTPNAPSTESFGKKSQLFLN